MIILLTGATGYIGTEVLEQCIKHNYIEHIYCLTRKALDDKYATHKKVTQIIHADFSQYPQYLLDKLADYRIEGCIWALGRTFDKYKDKDEAEMVEIHFRIQAANALASALATRLDPNAPPRKQKYPFRFIFMSAWGAEQDSFRSLWFWQPVFRKIKGTAEKAIFDVADGSEVKGGKKCFEAIALRPGGVIAGGDAITTILTEAVAPYIAVDRLAKCAIKTALEGTGYPDKRILENKDCLGDDWASINTIS